MNQALDCHGNIDTKFLQKEILQSLTDDIHVKQVDNAKKRAVKTSATFDEFKARVSCAHMKSLSRDEVLSLRDIKKGWNSKKVSALSNSLSLLSVDKHEVTEPHRFPVRKPQHQHQHQPKTVEELERDLKLRKSVDDRLFYLEMLTLPRFVALMKSHPSVDVFDSVLHTLTTSSSVSDQDRVAWLVALSSLSGFELLRRFMSVELKSQLRDLMISVKELHSVAESIPLEQINCIICKYDLVI